MRQQIYITIKNKINQVFKIYCIVKNSLIIKYFVLQLIYQNLCYKIPYSLYFAFKKKYNAKSVHLYLGTQVGNNKLINQ